jgi:hypothetical protein
MAEEGCGKTIAKAARTAPTSASLFKRMVNSPDKPPSADSSRTHPASPGQKGSAFDTARYLLPKRRLTMLVVSPLNSFLASWC